MKKIKALTKEFMGILIKMDKRKQMNQEYEQDVLGHHLKMCALME